MAGSDTGRMKASSSEVVAPARVELTTPTKMIANATSTIAMTDTAVFSRHQRAQDDQHAARHPERGLGLQPLPHRAGEVDQQQHRKAAERGEGRQRRVVDHLGTEGEKTPA